MKFIPRLAAIAISIIACAAASAQTPADTIKILKRANNVVVTRDGTKTRLDATLNNDDLCSGTYTYEVEVSEADEDFTPELTDGWEMGFPFNIGKEGRKKDSWRSGLTREISFVQNFYWGWRFNYHDRGHVKNNFECGILEIINANWKRKNGLSFSIGLGFGAIRVTAQNGFIYQKTGDNLVLAACPEGWRKENSSLEICRFQVPVLFSKNFGKGVNLQAGGVINLNSYASASAKTSSGNLSEKFSYKGLQQNLFTADIYASLSIHGIGIYASWSPMPIFKGHFGPNLKSWSIGVMILCD